MQRKVKTIADSITNILQNWETVQAVMHFQDKDMDVNDPYFVISLDVYCRDDFPHLPSRQKAFEDIAGGYETSRTHSKDRFLVDDLPVRIEYKSCNAVEARIADVNNDLSLFERYGTYPLHRFLHADVLYSHGTWLDESRTAAENFSRDNWLILRDMTVSRLEHYFSDLEAASTKENRYYYMISLAGFMQSAARMTYILNSTFEPSGREIAEQVFSLPVLPENFVGRFDALMQREEDYSRDKKAEVAYLLTKSLLLMSIE